MLGAASHAPGRRGGGIETARLDERQYRRVCQLVRDRARIELGDGKRQLCQTRLLRRLRALGLTGFGAYLELLEDPAHAEHDELINAITTNVTAFFREEHHFDLLADTVLPAQMATAAHAADRRLRVWSAGCSSGEEPWSIAMVVREVVPDSWDARILATDIDTQILARAQAGVYAEEQIEPVSPARRTRFLHRGTRANAGRVRVGDELRGLVTFKELNLFERWPMHGRFDVVFCRNVIIYFDGANKAALLRHFHDVLAPGGVLFLGHSESLIQGVTGFTAIGRTAYRRDTP